MIAWARRFRGARIAALFYSPLGLYFDEAQYWMWSRTFEWGYFTKPPMVAWVIGATTTLAGTDAEWAVRLGAPLAHTVAATAIFALTRAMYGSWPGFWAGLGWLLLLLSLWTTASGLFGVWLQKWIPAAMAGGLQVEALYERIPELVEGLVPGGTAVLNADDERVTRMAALRADVRVIRETRAAPSRRRNRHRRRPRRRW